MCGIVYAHDFKGHPVNNGILNVFDAQRKRGTQGFGLFDGQYGNIIKSTTEDKILNWLCKYESSLILFHHRYPTSTENTKNTAHPFTTKKYFGDNEYILVHNGHITNSWGLRNDHEELGIEYQSVQEKKFNDSEALLWDVALYLEGKQEGLKTVGGVAFICLKLVKGKLDKMYFGRNTNPLKLLRTKQGILLSSEGYGELIESDTLYTWNYKLKRLTTKRLEIPSFYQREYSGNWAGGWQNDTSTVPYKSPAYYEYDEEEDDYEAYMSIEVSNVDVEDKVMRYLILNEGNFERAYDDLEMDYMQISEDAVTLEDYTEMKLIEKTMERIAADEEWETPKSISSLYIQLSLVKE